MFYSHEILTQREYGVATIWLVATLGSGSGLRKVARKDILSCNLPKACDTVINPQAPLALRLQSNLLIGISRVYSKQLEYLYHDVWHAHTKLQKLDDPIKGTQSTLARGVQGRPDQLVLQDDPLLHADLLLDLDLGVLGEFREDVEREADSLLDYSQSVHNVSSFAHSTTPGGSVGGNVGFEVPESVARPEDGVVGWADGNLGLEEYPQFEFNEDGDIREVTPELPPPLPGAGDGSAMAPPSAIHRPAVPGSRADSEELAARVRQEHDQGAVGNEFSEGDGLLGAPPEQVSSHPTGQYDERDEPGPEEHEAQPERGGGEEEVARKLRGSRVNHITIDYNTQLHAREVKSFTYDYAANMGVAKVEKAARKLNREAKKIAKELVLERGIGGHLGNPLLKELFSGRAILDIIHGKGKSGGGGEARDGKVEQQIKGEDNQGAIMLDEGILEPQELGRGGVGSERGSVAVTDLEVGREAPTDDPAGDIQSIRHSTPRTGSAIPGSGAIMSVGGLRSSSVASAGWAVLGGESPLLARSAPRTVRQSAIGVGAGLENVQEEDENPITGDVSVDQFEFFEAAADVETQDVNTQATLERKSFQFFESVKNKLAKVIEEDAVDFITFEGLIGDGAGYRTVAAQALHHTLLLATKAMIRVKQEVPYGSIEIRAIPTAA